MKQNEDSTEFKVMVIKMLTEHNRRMDKLSESLKIQNIKKKSEQENTISEIKKKTLEGISNR